MAVGGTRNPRADHPMTTALLGGRAQTRPTKHRARLSSPASAICGSSEKGQQLEPSMRPKSWGLVRESVWTGSGITPRALTHSIKDAGESRRDHVELSSGDDDNGKNDDKEEQEGQLERVKEVKDVLVEEEVEEEEKQEEGEQNVDGDQPTLLHSADTTSKGTTGSRMISTDAKASSASRFHCSAPYNAHDNQSSQDNSLLFHGNGADLSKADDGLLYSLLVHGQQVHDYDLDSAAKSIQGPRTTFNEERVRAAQNTAHGNSLEVSASKNVNNLLQDLYSSDLLAVQEASQVHYGGAANAWRTASVATSLVGPLSPSKRDENSRVAMGHTSIAAPTNSYPSPSMIKTPGLGMITAGEHVKASMDAKGEGVVECLSQYTNIQAELVRSMTIGDRQGAIPGNPELKQCASDRDKREAQQRKKAAAFVERRRLLGLDKAEQLRKAEANRALKSQRDPEKTGKSLAAQVLRGQRERERERERLKTGHFAKDLARIAGIGEKNRLQPRPTETSLADGISGRVTKPPPLVAATTSVSAPTTVLATARATALPDASASILVTTLPTTTANASATTSAAPGSASTTAPEAAQSNFPAVDPATAWTISPAHTIQRNSFGRLASLFNSSSSSSHSATIVGKCAADEPLNREERESAISLQYAEDILRSAFEERQKRKPQTATLSLDERIEGTAPKKARSDQSTSQLIRDLMGPDSPSSRYVGMARSLSSTPSGITSPESRRTKMTTPERKQAKRVSALKYRRKKAEERALAQTARSSGSTTSQGISSNYSSPGVSISHDEEGEFVPNSVAIRFATLRRWSPSPSGGGLNFREAVSQKMNTKANEMSRNSEAKRDQRREFQRLKERQLLAKEKEVQRGLGSVTSSFTNIADALADEENRFETMEPMEVDPEPEEELPRPTTGGKTITQEMLDTLQQKPDSLLSFVDNSPYQEIEEDATYYEFVVKRLSWTADDEDDLEDIEPLLCHTGYVDVNAANKSAGDEILLERGDIRVYPLDEFHWKKDRTTGMAIYDGFSQTGNVRVFVDRILRPHGPGLQPSKTALKAARRISPIVYVILVKNTTTTTTATDTEATNDDDDNDLFEEAPPAKPVVNFTVDVCRTSDLANKLASKYVLDRLKAYQKPGELGEIDRAELEAEQRKYLKQLEEEELLYSMEPALLEEGELLEVWVEAQFLKGPCN